MNGPVYDGPVEDLNESKRYYLVVINSVVYRERHPPHHIRPRSRCLGLVSWAVPKEQFENYLPKQPLNAAGEHKINPEERPTHGHELVGYEKLKIPSPNVDADRWDSMTSASCN